MPLEQSSEANLSFKVWKLNPAESLARMTFLWPILLRINIMEENERETRVDEESILSMHVLLHQLRD